MKSAGRVAKDLVIRGLRGAKRAEMRVERALKRSLGYDVPVKSAGGARVHPWTLEDPGSPEVVDGLAARHCCGCGSCAQSCPRGAIRMVADDEGFLYPRVDRELCVGCGLCVRACPVLSEQPENEVPSACYAVWSNARTRLASSSGGMFGELARHVLAEGGAVFGAAYDEDGVVRHRMVESEAGLAALRGSKYVQSQMGECYRMAREALDAGRRVLFAGCPCQVAGLYAFLGGDRPNLLTADLICHGAPSPSLFARYLEETYGGQATSVAFRDKGALGWTMGMTVGLRDGSVVRELASRDPYCRMFSACLANRPFCAHCKFARLPRVGDFSLGDWWGVEKCDKALNDGNGTSLVLLNNARARETFERVRPGLEVARALPLAAALPRNGAIDHPLAAHPARTRFFDLLGRQSFGKSVRYALEPRFDVGLFGLWYGQNYGSILTYFGLVKVLEGLGLSVALLANPLGSDAGDRRQPTAFARRQGFFITKRRPLSRMGECNAFCDAFMVGSDQLWNPGLSRPYGQSYFLGFVDANRKRIAYGTSFGKGDHQIDARYRERSRLELARFDAISVRDDFSRQVLSEDYGLGSVKVLDPVLVCDPAEYGALADSAEPPAYVGGRAPQEGSPYVLAYVLDPNEGTSALLAEVSERMGLPVVVALDMNPKKVEENQALFSGSWRRGVHVLDEPTPEQWLAAIRGSEAVLTDSFHGTLFSHVFQRRFVALPNAKRGKDRFDDALGVLGLSDRALPSLEGHIEEVVEMLGRPIDYERSNALLQRERAHSLRWLRNALFSFKRVPTDRAYVLVEEKDSDERR